MKKLAIVTSHPIQYNAPWFALLNKSNTVKPKVFYTWQQSRYGNKYDPGFKKNIEWDIPLLDGYDYIFVENTATAPGTHHFNGLINPSLNKEIKAWQPDAVLVFGWSFNSHLKCLRYFHKKIPVLFRGDSTLLDEKKGIKKSLRRMFLHWVYRHVDIALYAGKNNKAYFVAHGIKDGQLVYMPHAIDNERFGCPAGKYQNEAEALRKNTGIQPQDIVLLFAGKLEEKKNPFFLIKLLNAISDERLKVLYVGSGALLPALQSAAVQDKRILIIDFQNQLQMPVIYRVADVFVLPSTGPGETWGLALNEAMASGKAVVASNKTGGAADLIDNGINGLITDLKNNEEVQCLLRKALTDKTVLKEMGRQSSLKIQSFTFGHIIAAIEDVMQRQIKI